jgi:NAD-dependent dihydropyrimidine dehydrogenase PreA subunit
MYRAQCNARAPLFFVEIGGRCSPAVNAASRQGDATEQQRRVNDSLRADSRNRGILLAMPASAECKEPGRLVPVIDTSRCEAKADCVEVCPYHVFTVRKLTDRERGALGLRTRLKVFVHGGKQAFVTKPDDCHACGLCVTACPEKAIKLRAAS